MGLRKMFGLPGYSELAELRAKEIDEVLAEVLVPPRVGGDEPVQIGHTFAPIFIAYAGFASRHGARVVVFANSVYDRAEQDGLLGWAKLKFPDLEIQRASKARGVRGPHPSMCIIDELSEWKPDQIRSHGG